MTTSWNLLVVLICSSTQLCFALPTRESEVTNHTKNDQYFDRQKRFILPFLGPHSTYISEIGIHCYVCHPGFFKKADCSMNMTTAVCQECPLDHYNSEYNIASRCATCAPYCMDQNAIVASPCNKTADMKCRCKDGFYNHSKGPGEWVCLPHSECPPGSETLSNGTATTDTRCQTCPTGTYSSTSSSIQSCLPCTVCGTGLTKFECQSNKDTVCLKSQTHWDTDDGNLILKVGLPIIIIAVLVIGVISLICFTRNCKNSRLAEKVTLSCPSLCVNEEENIEMTPTERLDEASNHHLDTPVRESPHLQQNGQTNHWTKVFLLICANLNIITWKEVIRTLLSDFKEESEIENVILRKWTENQGNTREQIYQCLIEWKQLSGEEPCLNRIIDVLKSYHEQDLIDKLKKKFSYLLSHDTLPKETLIT